MKKEEFLSFLSFHFGYDDGRVGKTWKKISIKLFSCGFSFEAFFYYFFKEKIKNKKNFWLDLMRNRLTAAKKKQNKKI